MGHDSQESRRAPGRFPPRSVEGCTIHLNGRPMSLHSPGDKVKSDPANLESPAATRKSRRRIVKSHRSFAIKGLLRGRKDRRQPRAQRAIATNIGTRPFPAGVRVRRQRLTANKDRRRASKEGI